MKTFLVAAGLTSLLLLFTPTGKLTLADLNEESANLLALQTRQQLGLNSLALASQSERSILSLFGQNDQLSD